MKSEILLYYIVGSMYNSTAPNVTAMICTDILNGPFFALLLLYGRFAIQRNECQTVRTAALKRAFAHPLIFLFCVSISFLPSQ
jgi:hypothetical protein